MLESGDCECSVENFRDVINTLEESMEFIRNHKFCKCDDEIYTTDLDTSSGGYSGNETDEDETIKKIKLDEEIISKKPAPRCFITKVLKRKGMELDEIALRKSKLSESTLNKYNQKYQVWVNHCKKKGKNPVCLNVGEMWLFFTSKIQSGITDVRLQQYLEAFKYIYPNPKNKDFRTFVTNIENTISQMSAKDNSDSDSEVQRRRKFI